MLAEISPKSIIYFALQATSTSSPINSAWSVENVDSSQNSLPYNAVWTFELWLISWLIFDLLFQKN